MLNSAKRDALDHKTLLAFCDYNPLTGVFTRKHRHFRFPVGSIMGYRGPKGYIQIKIFGRTYQANHLAWFYVKGEWSDSILDHRDRDPSNNRFINLRPATYSENGANRVGKNSNGYKGVCRCYNKFRATLRFKGHNLYLGLFDTAEQASAAYVSEAQKRFGVFARQN